MTTADNDGIDLSIIIPVVERYQDIAAVHADYKEHLDKTGLRYEIIYVVDDNKRDVLDLLNDMRRKEPIHLITLAANYGEATALNTAFIHAAGRILMTLPPYRQIESSEIPKLLSALDSHDMALARRHPRRDSFINRLQSRLFNSLLGRASGLQIHDAGCGVRAFRREILNDVHIYGDQHRFLPVFAHRQGFRVVEVDVAQSQDDVFRRVYPIGIYFRRLLDLLTVFFLIKFTKKPLRFFGLAGIGVTSAGLLWTAYLVIERIFFAVSLSDRPALFLSSLLIVLGIQIVAIGLIGEIIIFTHARDLKEYKVDRIVN